MKKTGIFLLIIAMLAVSNLVFATQGAPVTGVSVLALASTPTPTPTATPTPTITPMPTSTMAYPTPTPTAPPTIPPVCRISTLPATHIRATSATLNGSIEITSGNPTAYIYYWEASNPSVQYWGVGVTYYTGPGTFDITCDVTGLKPATQYEFVATSAQGQTGGNNGTVLGFTTLDPSIPLSEYKLTFTQGMHGSISVSPADLCGNTVTFNPLYYAPGTVVQLTAAGVGGFGFYSWTGDLTGNKNPTTITMDSDKTVGALFVEGQPGPTPTPTITPTPTPTSPYTNTPTPTPTTPPTNTPGSVKVQFFNSNTSATTNSIYPNFKLVNTGTSAITLSNIKMRYYYTIDGEKPQNFYCDWATAGSANVTGSFVKMATPKTEADYYLEVGFTASAGSLAAGASTEVKARFAKSDWSNYTQTGDYSFNSSASNYTDWTKVTGYQSGTLSWGVEP